MGRMYMIAKELDRLQVFDKVCKREMKLNKAAKLLNISKSEGAKGLISKKVGALGNNRVSEEKVALVTN